MRFGESDSAEGVGALFFGRALPAIAPAFDASELFGDLFLSFGERGGLSGHWCWLGCFHIAHPNDSFGLLGPKLIDVFAPRSAHFVLWRSFTLPLIMRVNRVDCTSGARWLIATIGKVRWIN